MRGKGHKHLAARSFQQWQKLPYNALCNDQMPTPLHATLRLPLRRVAQPSSSPSTPASVDVHLATNNTAVLQWWQREYDPFLVRDAHAQKRTGTTPTATHVLASTRVSAHVGPPAPPLGYPDYIAIEAKAYTEGVLRGESYAYHHTDVVGAVAAPPPGVAYLSPVKWIQQPLLDGFVAQRLTAHTGVTTGSLLDTRRTAMALGRQLPPFEQSPFYAASALLDRWCLFGEAAAVAVPPTPSSWGAALDGARQSQQPHDPATHHLRIAELALGAAVLPNYRAVWLNGAVLSHPGTGRSVLVVGPRRSGKTTLALHCLSAAARQASSSASSDKGVRLTAAEHFFLAAGLPVRRMLDPASARRTSPTIFACSLPHHITVGLGAVLGTLRPNPSLAAAVELPPFLQSEAGLRAFLRNTDGVLWDMSKTYRVRLQDIRRASSPDTGVQWDPVVVNTLAGVVLLDWNVEELARKSPTPVRSAVREIPLHNGGVEELLKRAKDYMFHGHHLLRTVYNAPQDAPARLASALADEWDTAHPRSLDDGPAPALHCIEGSVNFDLATQLIMGLLSKPARTSAHPPTPAAHDTHTPTHAPPINHRNVQNPKQCNSRKGRRPDNATAPTNEAPARTGGAQVKREHEQPLPPPLPSPTRRDPTHAPGPKPSAEPTIPWRTRKRAPQQQPPTHTHTKKHPGRQQQVGGGVGDGGLHARAPPLKAHPLITASLRTQPPAPKLEPVQLHRRGEPQPLCSIDPANALHDTEALKSATATDNECSK
ncbi:hypothetical protein, conserved [Leishmania tarentolae]|uniref:Uncharacterized protein n=1 Tax=Leishmania tarentolae TaxID=5689 RepID=A0A640K7P3_LEITA|nr:hypothetical protein, conserved [Leishmania tarentolae]